MIPFAPTAVGGYFGRGLRYSCCWLFSNGCADTAEGGERLGNVVIMTIDIPHRRLPTGKRAGYRARFAIGGRQDLPTTPG